MKNLNRRKFLGNVSLTALSAVITSFIPIKILEERRRKLKFKLNKHPHSVKRTK